MLIFSAQKLAYIAVPKTGSTAIDMALKPKADILFTKRRKHMTAQRFHAKIAPFLEKEFGLVLDRFAVMREPEEQIRSWYRYRAREERDGDAFSTNDISFDEFVRAVISTDPPPFATIGSQMGMLTGPGAALRVHHLFAHETPTQMRGFLTDRFQEEIALKPKNVSPAVPADLDAATAKALRKARASEFDLYARLQDANGHLHTATLDP